MPDNEEMLYLCPDCYYHLLNLTNELEVMTWEQKIERLRKITSIKEFEEILVNLGELLINHRKGNNDNTH